MEIILTRKTGFWGMGSPIQILLDGRPVMVVNENQTRRIEIQADSCQLQAVFYFMKSPLYTIKNTGSALTAELTLAPAFLPSYFLTAVLPFLVFGLSANFLWLLLAAIAAVIAIVRLAKRAYVLNWH